MHAFYTVVEKDSTDFLGLCLSNGNKLVYGPRAYTEPTLARNPVTGCLFIERRDPEILLLCFSAARECGLEIFDDAGRRAPVDSPKQETILSA